MNHEKSAMASRTGRILLLSFIVIFVAQINMNLFTDDFKISIAVICFPVFLYLLDYMPLIPVTILSASGVHISRILLYWLQHGSIRYFFRPYLPEFFFYLIYGCLLYVYTRAVKSGWSVVRLLLSLVLIDYFSNLTELLLRVGTEALVLHTQLGILVVALARSALAVVIITIFNRYRLTLLNREHAERYERLMLLISRLNGEVIWMQKNSSFIEKTMNTSYQLYHKLQEKGGDPDLANSALKIARDIHEIKKEYQLIMRGLSEALHTETQVEGMPVSDILALLENAVTLEGKAVGKKVSVTLKCNRHLYTDRHYLLLSVFHNLFNNALEASVSDTVNISLIQTIQDRWYLFTISDDGPGIDKDCMDQIFDPGFSTKINYDTGTISRGLGLNIVKDIVEHKFHGQIAVTSRPGDTTFTLYIPIDELEEKDL